MSIILVIRFIDIWYIEYKWGFGWSQVVSVFRPKICYW